MIQHNFNYALIVYGIPISFIIGIIWGYIKMVEDNTRKQIETARKLKEFYKDRS